MLKVGIVGMGGMGRHHSRRYPQIPNARIVAIADIVPERLALDGAVQTNLSAGAGVADLSDVARYLEGLDLIKSVRETIRIGEEGGLPAQITHHKAMGGEMWGKSVETLAREKDFPLKCTMEKD